MTQAVCTRCGFRLAIDHETTLCAVCAHAASLERQVTLDQTTLGTPEES